MKPQPETETGVRWSAWLDRPLFYVGLKLTILRLEFVALFLKLQIFQLKMTNVLLRLNKFVSLWGRRHPADRLPLFIECFGVWFHSGDDESRSNQKLSDGGTEAQKSTEDANRRSLYERFVKGRWSK